MKERFSESRFAVSRVARVIDHTLLKPDITKAQIIQLCDEAVQHQFAAVCVNPVWVETAAHALRGSKIGIATVVGFPLGATSSFVKAAETRDAIAAGATEIDMVMQIGALKSGDDETVLKDIESVVLAGRGHATVKVIIETGYLTNQEKWKACQLAKAAGAHYVKTSTGFGPGAATVRDVVLMREAVGEHMGVKASGGVRDFDSARALIAAGATRIGTSAGVTIVQGESRN